MKKLVSLLALAIAMSTSTVAFAQESQGDGPCYDACVRTYDKCRAKTPPAQRYQKCYMTYVKCLADCDAGTGNGYGEGGGPQVDYEDERPL